MNLNFLFIFLEKTTSYFDNLKVKVKKSNKMMSAFDGGSSFFVFSILNPQIKI